MVNHTSVLILSAFIIVIPQLGFPNAWQKNITSALAVLIVILTIRSMRSQDEDKQTEGDTYVDAQPIKLADSSHTNHENNG